MCQEALCRVALVWGGGVGEQRDGEGSAALEGGGCSDTPCQDTLNHLSHGSLRIVTPKRLIIRADARLMLAGEAEKLSLCSIPQGAKTPQYV